ncbi:hypothetical protein [Rothia sp. 11254D007CT]
MRTLSDMTHAHLMLLVSEFCSIGFTNYLESAQLLWRSFQTNINQKHHNALQRPWTKKLERVLKRHFT